jgi:peptide/nickel transport system ATP-binding protein
LSKHYPGPNGPLRAVDEVSLSVDRGETVALIGESGCGKSTLAKTLMRLIEPTAGRIEFAGEDVTGLDGRRLRTLRKRFQMVFQESASSLNPRHTIRSILSTPLKVHGVADKAVRARIVEAMVDRITLPRNALNRYPHEFSGGERQRIGIARALILTPEMVVCDEPVSALDLAIQAQILNLLVSFKKEHGVSYLVISHDLSVVRFLADRVMVMYLGRIVESADNEALWASPKHPYTQALVAAIPDPQKRRPRAPAIDDLPGMQSIPLGCRFNPRCAFAADICRVEEPKLREIGLGHKVACHLAEANQPNGG